MQSGEHIRGTLNFIGIYLRNIEVVFYWQVVATEMQRVCKALAPANAMRSARFITYSATAQLTTPQPYVPENCWAPHVLLLPLRRYNLSNIHCPSLHGPASWRAPENEYCWE